MWQGIYQELKDRNFVIVSVAFDTGGRPAVKDFIRPPGPIELPLNFQEIMGWSAEQYARAAAPTYPNLIDEKHIVAELYNMTNVPMGVWIDENRQIVRPAEPAGASDGFRAMDRTTFQLTKDAVQRTILNRMRYVDAVRDWVMKGAASEYALSAEEVRRRIEGPQPVDALAMATFRMGQYLYQAGHRDDSRRYFNEARRLSPERWHYFRQALDLEETGKASGPEFFQAVDALGDRPYYPPVNFKPSR